MSSRAGRQIAATERMKSFVFPHSLRYQLLSRMLLIVAALLLVIGLFQYLLMERFLYQNRASAIQRQIQSVPGDMWERFNSFKRRGPADSFIFFPSSSVAFVDKEGKMTVLSTINGSSEANVPHLDSKKYAEALDSPRKAKPRYEIVHQQDDGEQLVVIQAVRSFNGTMGVVQVSTSTKPLKGELYRQLLLFGGLALAALIGGLLTFLPAIRRTLTPLSRMIATVEQIDSGTLAERLPENGLPLEIDRLSHSFNRMLERLQFSFLAEQEAKEQMRRFVADASHELRTPLTSIHGFLEVLLRGAVSDPEKLTRALRSMHGESERIIKLVNDLLLLAKLDRAPELRLKSTDLSSLVIDMEPQLRILAGDREIRIDAPRTAIVPLDDDKIKQVLLNLFHNAVQHTDPVEGVIRIVVARDESGHGASLTIQDNGTGIAEEHLPHLFERFYRIDSSRARKHGGAGLGLSISRSIVELHGGHIKGTSRLGEGSLFRIDLPGIE
ncbi:HAMP domain-containing protein [Cohnella endophytica]|uniref:histidine kinase n=1 Tax=Cohnella endophytica TaxID=2419778 RepID=A0A494Y5T3_9BACL|nr:HAMP domain-containing sensor histidine kinase [Cohnella endophytica]RKP56875.1 HAMP domain-containing protein [Cohnella endophytica]